ncbi:conserved phage C-terminal domain-containing protein [Dolosigranulum savutiense]|uniref:Conserved phage C-terminal domain-containing protein n=1 Tax=Dolosigranulum savutiense TaxID=3110288 RepID=A0AB74TV93_9LACT
MSRALVKDLLMASSGYWVLNKKIVAMYGVETAFFLTSLAEAETYVTKGKGGWFYQTIETVENLTGLTRYKQDRALKELVDDGVVETDVRGMPAKRYMKLNYKRLHDKFVNLPQTSLQKTHKQECKKTTNKDAENLQTSLRVSYNNKELNKELKDKELSNKDISSGKPDRIPYAEIVDYLNEKTDRQFKSTTKKTQSLIRARLNEGWEVEHFKTVIDNKVAQWKDDNEMQRYLRPDTLFGTKFEGYLNEDAPKKSKQEGWFERDEYARNFANPRTVDEFDFGD